MTLPQLVLDTNIALDVLVFQEEKTALLKQAVENRHVQWLTTKAMRDELERVLSYPAIAPRVDFYQLTPNTVLGRFDALGMYVAPAEKAPVVCRDADDQKFIDLAIAHRATLVSKDKLVLACRKRALPYGVQIVASYPTPLHT